MGTRPVGLSAYCVARGAGAGDVEMVDSGEGAGVLWIGSGFVVAAGGTLGTAERALSHATRQSRTRCGRGCCTKRVLHAFAPLSLAQARDD